MGELPQRKRRTRAHVIAEMSANHFERQALLCGFSVERIRYDYGIDLVMTTYDHTGEVQNGQVLIQLKASDQPRTPRGSRHIVVRVLKKDLESWLKEAMPVILSISTCLAAQPLYVCR
jgi:hypothetical protein